MTHKTNNISILQFNERIISRLRIRRSAKGVEVIGFDQTRGEWPVQDGALAQALKEFAEKHHLDEDTVYSVLPRHDMTARILELPSQDPKELDNMVQLSAEEFVPFPIEELALDQCVLEELPDGQARVLAVFAHKDVVETHIAILQQAHIELEQVYVSTACLASAAATGGPKENSFALVNLAPGGLEIVVIKDGRLAYGRAVASMQEWEMEETAGEEAIEELAVETRASLTAYRRESEMGEGVGAVYLCSEFADVAPPCDTLHHELGQECAPAGFARDLVAHGGDMLEGTPGPGSAAGYPVYPVVMLGAALIAQGRGRVNIHLLPRSVIEARQRVGVRRTLIRFAAAAAALVAAAVGLYAEAVYQRSAYVRQLNARIEEIRPHAMGILSKQKQLRILQRQVERSGGAVELLAALCDLFPEAGVNISRFLFIHNDRIELCGRAKTRPELEKLVEDILQAGKSTLEQFSRAQRVYETQVMEHKEKILEFKIVMPFPETEAGEQEDKEDEGGLYD